MAAPYTRQRLLAEAERVGRTDALAGRQPKPPLTEDLCRAYWAGYRSGMGARPRSTRPADRGAP